LERLSKDFRETFIRLPKLRESFVRNPSGLHQDFVTVSTLHRHGNVIAGLYNR
jgi:hypothetical protein